VLMTVRIETRKRGKKVGRAPFFSCRTSSTTTLPSFFDVPPASHRAMSLAPLLYNASVGRDDAGPGLGGCVGAVAAAAPAAAAAEDGNRRCCASGSSNGASKCSSTHSSYLICMSR